MALGGFRGLWLRALDLGFGLKGLGLRAWSQG